MSANSRGKRAAAKAGVKMADARGFHLDCCRVRITNYTMFSKPRNRGNVRKRGAESEKEQDEAETDVVRHAKQQKKNPMAFSTKTETANQSAKLLYESDRRIQQADDQGATRQVETETATDRDARCLPEQGLTLLVASKSSITPNSHWGVGCHCNTALQHRFCMSCDLLY